MSPLGTLTRRPPGARPGRAAKAGRGTANHLKRRSVVAKGQITKKDVKKKPEKTLKEKRQEKKAKKAK
jgi:hypothetical protein